MTVLELNREINKFQLELDKLKRHVGLLEKRSSVKKGVENITNAVEDQYKLSKGSVYEATRKRIIVEARQISMVLIHCSTGLEIGKISLLFRLDKGCVIHAEKIMSNFFETNTVIYNNFVEVCHKLNLDENNIKQTLNTIIYDRTNRIRCRKWRKDLP